MGQSADQLRQEIDQKRYDAADKIDQLQQQVVGTADQMREQAQESVVQVRDQVQDSVVQVRDQVQESVTDTIQSVKDTVSNVDFNQQIQERPLLALGAALVGGFILGSLGGGGGGNGQHYQGYNGQQGGTIGNGVRSAMKSSGLEDMISNGAAALMGSVTEQVKGTVDKNFPGFADKLQSSQSQSQTGRVTSTPPTSRAPIT